MPLRSREFRLSKKLYAFDPASFLVKENPTHNDIQSWRYSLSAVWYTKRNNGKRAAVFGELWDHSSARPDSNGVAQTQWTLEDFIAKVSTARYGGTPYGLWDGTGTWWSSDYANDLSLQQATLPLLQQQLAGLPTIPVGYEGWYAMEETWA